jgi:FlaA1/EpsC-like NDP-sugar epimerase
LTRQILVTGAAGSIGSALVRRLEDAGETVDATDRDTLNVVDIDDIDNYFLESPPDLVFHLAGAKHAPEGEVDPFTVANTNIRGTALVVGAAVSDLCGARVVMASTCKACDPETAYGASKLVAERIVLNAGGTVARFFNVVESCGNVFETWRALPDDVPLPVTPCSRYFMSLDQAVDLLLRCAELPSGRYCVDPGPSRTMWEMADELYPSRIQAFILPRRGDRLREPLHAAHERWVPLTDGVVRVVSPHDPVPALVAA